MNCSRCGRKIGFFTALIHDEKGLCFTCIRDDERAEKAAKPKAKTISKVSSTQSQPKKNEQNTVPVTINNTQVSQPVIDIPTDTQSHTVSTAEPNTDAAAESNTQTIQESVIPLSGSRKKIYVSHSKSNLAWQISIILGLIVAVGAAAGPYFYFRTHDARQQTVSSTPNIEKTVTATHVESDRTLPEDVKSEEDRKRATERLLWIARSANANFEEITRLIQAGADVNAKSTKDLLGREEIKTVLMMTAERSSPDVVTALIQAGADVNAKYVAGWETNQNGWTALIWGTQNSSAEVITALVRAGADVNAKDVAGRTALMIGAGIRGIGAGNNSFDVVTALIQAGADINAKDARGWTALMEAAMWNRSAEVITALVKAGADVNAKNVDGQTALDIAKEVRVPHNFLTPNNPDVVTALVRAGNERPTQPTQPALTTEVFH